MKILFLGDIVGQPGVDLVRLALPTLVQREAIDLVVANAENASGGSGMTPRVYRQMRTAGVDLVTMGDHLYKKMELLSVLEKEDRICKPANFPAEAPGRDVVFAPAKDGTLVAVVSLLGRTFMRPVDCPFHAIDRLLPAIHEKTRVVLVDIHAEATGEKYLVGHHLKGRVSAVIGTHTHVQTADEQVLPGGTAFLCDAGMCGPYDSVLGRRIDRVLATTITFVPTMFDVAQNDARLAGAIVDVDPASGQATAIRRLMLRTSEVQAWGIDPLPRVQDSA